jgi:K+-transporting ATPase ATPase A chain
MWLIPLLVIGLSAGLSVPLGRYLARVLDRPAGNRLERLLDTGGQDWKRYCFSMIGFNVLAFVAGYAVLSLQHELPLNPDGKKRLAETTVFNTACSFLTNTNLQHYSGEVHLSYFSQVFVIVWKQFIGPAVGLTALLAVIRGLRGDAHLGNFYLDLWRGVAQVLLPLALVVAILLVLGGVPMTLDGAARVTTVEGGEQAIARGPVAALVAIKQLGTNGGGFFGTNSAHPFENPSAWTNLLECVSIVLIPMACVVMFGRMLNAGRHAAVLFGVCLLLYAALTTAAVLAEAGPNPGLAGLPVDQSAGTLEGKELRFGPGAAGTWAATTTCTSNGSVNCMHDSLTPLGGLVPLTGMWVNCLFGGVGVGLINLLVFLIVAVFLAGLMVGRTPEYLGKKVEAREMKLAMLALLIHPLMILAPAGLFCEAGWADAAKNNPGPHGLSETVYEFTSASANNGSGFEGLADTTGVAAEHDDDLASDDPQKRTSRADARYVAGAWDIATGLVMVICRFVPIVAPIALAASLSRKKPTPFTAGSLRTDTATFGAMLLATILLAGALLFLPAAALGPVAEHVSFAR